MSLRTDMDKVVERLRTALIEAENTLRQFEEALDNHLNGIAVQRQPRMPELVRDPMVDVQLLEKEISKRVS